MSNKQYILPVSQVPGSGSGSQGPQGPAGNNGAQGPQGFQGPSGGGGGVTSFSGDGTILSNSSSTGAVTATLESVAATTILSNSTTSSATPTFTTNPGATTYNTFSGTTAVGRLTTASTSELNLGAIPTNGSIGINSNLTSGAGPGIIVGGFSSLTATAGVTGVQIGLGSTTSTVGSLVWAPASGSGTFTAFKITPGINQSGGTGSYIALSINAVETTLLGSANLLINAAAGSAGTTVKFTVDNSGNAQHAGAVVAGSVAVSSPTAGFYYSGSTAGVSAGSFSSITAITATGGIVTQLTGTSDERLKDSVAYDGGLDEILAITPVRYHWNVKGQEHTGLPGEQEFVGFLAQDVQKAIPEAITATEPSKDKTDAYLSLDDRPILAAAINAIKELKAEIEALKSQK
jgi:hypothetical protein